MWQQVIRLVWRFTYAFTANNNVRLLTLWAVTFVWFIAHALLFGIALGPEHKSGLSEVAQRFNNYHLHRQWVTTAELAGAFAGFGESVGEIARWISGKVLFALIIASLIYFPIAMRDEVQRAWQIALRRFRERRGGLTDLPNQPAPAPAPAGGGAAPTPAAPKALTWKEYVSFELLSDFVQELIAHTVFQRRR